MSDENVIEDVAGLDRLTPGEWVIDADGDALCLVDTHLGWPQRMWMPKAKKNTLGLVVSLEHARFPVALAEVDPEYVCKHNRGTNECGHCYLCGVVVSDARPMYFDAATLDVVREAGRANAEVDARRASDPTVAEFFMGVAQDLGLPARARREALEKIQQSAEYLERKSGGSDHA